MQLNHCNDESFCPRTDKHKNTTCCDNHQEQFAVIGHARIPKSVVSSIRATGISTASSALHTNFTSSIAPATASQTTTSKSALTSTSASTSASTPASTSASTSLSASAAGLNQSAKIGIGVGISLGTLLFALLSFITFLFYRNSQSKSPTLGIAEEAASEPQSLEMNVNTGLQQRYELTGAESPREMYTLYNTHEIEATSGASEFWNSGLDG